MGYNIAIIGATGLVGRKTLEVLSNHGISEKHNLFLFASHKSAGKKIKISNNKKQIVEELNKENLAKQKWDFALFCVRENISQIYVKFLANRGVKVIDFSSAFRHKFPLVVPEINSQDISNSNIICNPNCSTAISVVTLNKIALKFGLKNIVFSTYQAVSGAGQLSLKDFKKANAHKLKKLDYPITNNLIPYIGKIDKQGYSQEENKMIYETQKILHLQNANITATCIRVPVKNCHTISVYFETDKPCTLKQVKNLLADSLGVDFEHTIPMPINANNMENVFVGRLKAHKTKPNCFSFVVCGDNLLKGASLNAVQILEKLIEVKNENK